jgi:hypothetical protein
MDDMIPVKSPSKELVLYRGRCTDLRIDDRTIYIPEAATYRNIVTLPDISFYMERVIR